MRLIKSIIFCVVVASSLLRSEQPTSFNVIVKDLKIADKTVRVSPFQGVGVVTIQLCFKNAGEKLSPKNKEAVVALLSKSVGEATNKKTREQLQDYASEHNVAVSCNSDDDDFVIMGRCPSNKLSELVSLLKELLLEPRFLEKDLTRFKNEITAVAMQTLQSPDAQLGEFIKETLLANHPYGALQATYLKSLKNIKGSDLKWYMKAYFSQENLIIGVCGEFDEEVLINQLSSILQALPKTGKINLPTDHKITGPYEMHSRKFSVPQTVIRMMHEGIDINHPDFFALQIAMGCLSNPGIGILWKKIREEKGLTYGIGAGFTQQDHFKAFCIQTSTQTETVNQTLQAIKEVLADTYQNGIPAELIETVKKSFLGNYKRSFASTQHIAARLTKYQRDGRPVDFHNVIIKKISALTADEVNEALKRFLKLDQFVVFAVGE